MPKAAAALVATLCACALPAPAFAAPVNDDFAAALGLGVGDVEHEGANFGATKEPGEPDHAGEPGGASVWFEWAADRSERTLLQVCGEAPAPLAAVYVGASLGDLVPVATTRSGSIPDSCRELRFRASAGRTYRIAVDGLSDSGGVPSQDEFWLRLWQYGSSPPPANDDFAAATALSPTASWRAHGSTESATREVGEPAHSGRAGNASVWFTWTAPQSGRVGIYPCASGFRPLVAVYRGSALEGLEPVGLPAPPRPVGGVCSPGWSGTGVELEAVAGERYSIAVDGEDGDWGAFVLLAEPVVAPFQPFLRQPSAYILKLLRGRKSRITFQFGAQHGRPLCKIDRSSLSPCRSPIVYRGLRPGWHRFLVTAVDPAGNRDPTPAVRRFRVAKR